MSLSQPRQIYGIHSVSPYSRTTREFYGILKVLENSSLSLSGDLIEVRGGSSKFSWAVEDGAIHAEMALKPMEYPDFLFTLFLGKAPTATTSDTAGTIYKTLTNVTGTSVVAATGLVGVTVKAASKLDVKFGTWVVKAVTSTTVDVYAGSDADFANGTDLDFVNDLLKITTTPLTISTGAAVDIPTVGLTLTGGASATAFVAGDTAYFKTAPLSTKGISVVVGGAKNTFPEFGCIIMAQRRSNNELCEIDAYRVKGIGLPIMFESFKWSTADIKAKLLYDSVLDGIFELRHVTATNS